MVMPADNLHPTDRPGNGTVDRPVDRDRSVPELFSTVINQITTLFRQEVQLAKTEVGEKVNHVTGAITPLAAGGALLFGALILLLMALAQLLTTFGLAIGWSLLIVGVVAALGGYLLIRGGLSQLKSTNLTPNRTAEQLTKDAQVAKEQVR
jgi:uncharacterized membrane protein